MAKSKYYIFHLFSNANWATAHATESNGWRIVRLNPISFEHVIVTKIINGIALVSWWCENNYELNDVKPVKYFKNPS